MRLVPEFIPQDLDSTRPMGFLFIWMIFLHRFSPNSRNRTPRPPPLLRCSRISRWDQT